MKYKAFTPGIIFMWLFYGFVEFGLGLKIAW